MAKKNAELEEYLKVHNVDAVPPKIAFRDKRMNLVECPLCGKEMKLIKLEEHTFGEFGLYQCMTCGAYIDICNMVNLPQEFELISKLFHGKYFQSLRGILKGHSEFISMPEECSIHHIAAQKDRVAADKEDRMDYCISCKTKFTPQKSCIAVRDYCKSCRKDIPKEDDRWKKDVKRTKEKEIVSTKKKVVKSKYA
jgi:hypothetical protein